MDILITCKEKLMKPITLGLIVGNRGFFPAHL